MNDSSRLDAFAEHVAGYREHLPELAPIEQAFIRQFTEIAPDGIDQRAVGAGWLILGNVLTGAQGLTTEQIVEAMKLAGQQLYNGGDVRPSGQCPHVYDTGKRCSYMARASNSKQLATYLDAHRDLYHPIAELDHSVPEPFVQATPAEVAQAYERSAQHAQGAPIEGVAATAYCACGAPAAMVALYGDERVAIAQCTRCAVRDPRSPFIHRDLAPGDAALVDPNPPPEDARGIVGGCVHCGKTVYAVGAEGEIAGKLTFEGPYCEPCYTKLSSDGNED